MNSQTCPHAVGWLAFIAGMPILAAIYVLYMLNQPVDPWAAGAYWGAVIVFYGAPGVLIPLICGIFTCFAVLHRKEKVSRCLLLAISPSISILIVSLMFFFYTSMQATKRETREWQHKVYALPMQEREPIQQYLTMQEIALNWLDASNPLLNHRLVRLSANAEACLRQKLPNVEEERIYELNQWIHVGETGADNIKIHALWQDTTKRYESDYQLHRRQCDETLNFNTVQKRYPNG